MSDDFSIRMKGDDGLAPPASLFSPKPDKKGPKTIAILLILGALAMGVNAYGDIQLSQSEDLTKEELDALLTNIRTGNGDNITDEEYQDYHDEARDSGAYVIRGSSVMIGSILILVGGIMLFRLNSLGSKLAIGGSAIAACGGIYSNYELYTISQDMLPESLVLANEILGYLCGFCMVICASLAALPLFNSAAKAALDPKIILVTEEEIPEPEEIVGSLHDDVTPEEEEEEEELSETDDTVGNVYNIQNITIQDSVVVDSAFKNNSEEE